MFGVSMWELIVVLLVLFLVVGPTKLPDLAKSIGQGIRDLQKNLKDVRDTVQKDDEFVQAVREAKRTVIEAQESIRGLFDVDDVAEHDAAAAPGSAGPAVSAPALADRAPAAEDWSAEEPDAPDPAPETGPPDAGLTAASAAPSEPAPDRPSRPMVRAARVRPGPTGSGSGVG